MKYYYFTYVFCDGDREYYNEHVLACHESDNPEALIRKHVLSDMFGEETIEEDGVFYRDDYCVAVKLRGLREIPKKHYDILKQYLLHTEIEPEPEKVSLT